MIADKVDLESSLRKLMKPTASSDPGAVSVGGDGEVRDVWAHTLNAGTERDEEELPIVCRGPFTLSELDDSWRHLSVVNV